MEIAQRVWARKNRSDVKSELKSEDPAKVRDDIIFYEEEESKEVIVTLIERCDPMATSTGDEKEVERHSDVPMPRKRAVSPNAVGAR